MDKTDPSNTESANRNFSKSVQAVAASTKGPVEDHKSKKGFERSAARKKNKAADKQKQADEAAASGNTRKAARKQRSADRKTKKAKKLNNNTEKKSCIR